LNFYRTAGRESVNYYRAGRRAGAIEIEGKKVPVALVENNNDGVFTKDSAKPVWLIINEIRVDARKPFRYESGTYEADLSPDGSRLAIRRSNTELPAPPKPLPDSEPVLPPGTVAPDFTAEKWGGGALKLSDYRGKILVLDLWATWCGPCLAAMPHLEELYKKTKGTDVEVLALNVLDDKAAYEKWVPANRHRYTFPVALDPAGRGDSSIARSLFKVRGIPTTFVIDKEGKVAATIVGYSTGDKRIEEALEKLGAKLAP
jgi:thiol-disulfide isomerase/thioredoxin